MSHLTSANGKYTRSIIQATSTTNMIPISRSHSAFSDGGLMKVQIRESKVNPKKMLNSYRGTCERDDAICRSWAAGLRGGPRWLRPCSTEDPQRTRRRDPQAAHTYVAHHSIQVHWSERTKGPSRELKCAPASNIPVRRDGPADSASDSRGRVMRFLPCLAHTNKSLA